MAYTTNEFIANAYYLSQVVARDLETVSGSQLSNGLKFLNAIISLRNINASTIPYYSAYVGDFIVSQEMYFIPKLIEPETFTFNYGNVRFQTGFMSRSQYFGTPRANNVSSLPMNWRTERTKGGSNLYVYFLPQSTYQFTIFGKFGYESISIGDDLSEIFDEYYTEYLKYKTAKKICSEYGTELNAEAQRELAEMEKAMQYVESADLTMNKISSFNNGYNMNFFDASIKNVWRPG